MTTFIRMATLTQKLPLTPVSAINPFLLELTRRKLDPVALLESLSLPQDIPARKDLFVSALSIYEFAEGAANLAGDRYLGFRVGQGVELKDWAPFAGVLKTTTLADLLSSYVIAAEEMGNQARYHLTMEDGRTAFGFLRRYQPTAPPAQSDAFATGMFAALFERLLGADWHREVLFKVVDPSVIPQLNLQLALGNKDGFEFSFPNFWMQLPVEKSVLARPLSAYAHPLPPESLVESFRHALMPHLHDPALSVTKAAEICGWQKHRLARELRILGTTIADEIAAMRFEQAERELIQTDQKISQIAETIGFGDATAFSRAFKKRTGLSPAAFRRQPHPETGSKKK